MSWVKKKINFFLWILNVFDGKELSYSHFFQNPA